MLLNNYGLVMMTDDSLIYTFSKPICISNDVLHLYIYLNSYNELTLRCNEKYTHCSGTYIEFKNRLDIRPELKRMIIEKKQSLKKWINFEKDDEDNLC